MGAWKEDQKTEGSLISLYADTRSEFTNALDLVLDHDGPMSVLGNKRCKRFSMLVKDCVVKTLNVAAAEDDPAGDDRPEISMVDKMLEDLKEKKDEL
jgi:peroxiredoxin